MWQLLIAVCAWAFANLFFKIARVHLPTTGVFIWQTAGIVLVSFIVFFLARGQDVSTARLPGVLWAFFGGAVSIIGAYFFLESLGTIRLGIAVPFSSLHVVLTCILGVLLLREKMTLAQIIGAIAMVIGSMLLGISNAK